VTEDQIAKLARDAEMRKIMVEAIDEWLDKKFSQFGRWSFYGFVAAVAAGSAYLMLISGGWHK